MIPLGILAAVPRAPSYDGEWMLDHAAFEYFASTSGVDSGGSSNNLQGLAIKPDGTRLYLARGTGRQRIYQADLSTPWDLSALSYTGEYISAPQLDTGNSLTFSPDGAKMFHLSGDQYLYYWVLSTPWDITTATYTDTRIGLGGSNNQCLQFSPDGAKFFVTRFNGNNVAEFSMSTPWDITTATLAAQLSFSNPTGLAIKPDGSRMWVARYQAGTGFSENRVIVEYALPTAWSLSGATATGKTYNYSSYLSQVQALVVRPDGKKMFLLNNYSTGTEGIYQFAVA